MCIEFYGNVHTRMFSCWNNSKYIGKKSEITGNKERFSVFLRHHQKIIGKKSKDKYADTIAAYRYLYIY